jgi:hypothetical protein
MEIGLDKDVQAVAEYMQRSLPAAALIRVSLALAEVGPLLWGPDPPLTLREPSIS